MSTVIDRENSINLIVGGISRNLGEIQVLLTRSRTYDFPMTNSLGCSSTKQEEIRWNKAINFVSSDYCELSLGVHHYRMLMAISTD